LLIFFGLPCIDRQLHSDHNEGERERWTFWRWRRSKCVGHALLPVCSSDDSRQCRRRRRHRQHGGVDHGPLAIIQTGVTLSGRRSIHGAGLWGRRRTRTVWQWQSKVVEICVH